MRTRKLSVTSHSTVPKPGVSRNPQRGARWLCRGPPARSAARVPATARRHGPQAPGVRASQGNLRRCLLQSEQRELGRAGAQAPLPGGGPSILPPRTPKRQRVSRGPWPRWDAILPSGSQPVTRHGEPRRALGAPETPLDPLPAPPCLCGFPGHQASEKPGSPDRAPLGAQWPARQVTTGAGPAPDTEHRPESLCTPPTARRDRPCRTHCVPGHPWHWE